MILNSKEFLLHLLSNILSTNNLIMAVEKSKVITRLKALFPKANLSQKRLDALADKLASKPADDADDVAIDLVINGFNDILSIEEIAKEDDRVRTLESKSKEPADPPKNDPPKADLPKGDVPEWAQVLLDSNKKMETELEAIKTGKIIETKKQTASELFGKSELLKGLKPEVKERWINRIDVNSEIPLDEQIKALESEYSDLVQVSADNNQYAPGAGGGNPSPKYDEKEIERLVSEV